MAKELTKTLVKDISCNPINPESGLFLQICERANFWGEKATKPGIPPVLGQAIQAAASELLKNLASDQDEFQFDLKMIEAVGQRLESQSSAIKQDFSHLVSTISQHYVESVEKLFPAINLQNTEVVKKAKEISAGVRTVAHEVEIWARGANDVLGAVAKLPFPKEVKGFLQELKALPVNVETVATQIGSVMDSLWQDTTNAVTKADELSEKAKALKNPPPAETPSQKLQRESELKAIESQLARHKPGLENTLNNIKTGFHALGIIAGSFGKSQLASDIVAVGEAAVTVAGSIATLLAGSAATGPAMPIVAIAGAVAMLASRFFAGRAAQREDVILKTIDRLSKHMDERFDRVELIIQKSVEYLAEHIDRRFLDLGNHIDKRFDRIEDTLKYMYKDMLQQFAKLHEHQEEHLQVIQHKLDGLRQAIDYLHTDMTVNMALLYEQNYREKRDQALTRIAREQITLETHLNCYAAIIRWTTEQVKSNAVAGNEQPGDLVVRIRPDGINMFINKLRVRAVQLGQGIQNPGRLVNPTLWAEGVRTLISYFALTPKLYTYITPREELLRNLAAIKGEGVGVRDFVHSVQKNFPLFEKLIEQYRLRLMQVMQSAYDIGVTPDASHPIGTPSSGPERALMRVTAIEVSDSFMQREVYPGGRQLPSLGNPEAIAVHAEVQHPFPQAKILKAVGIQFAAGLREKEAYHNDGARAVCHAASEGRAEGGFAWALSDANPNSPTHDWNTFKTHYDAARQEAGALRTACTTYRDYLRDSHLNELATNSDYRKGRIASILSHHAVAEKDSAKGASKLPHFNLMKKYFSIKNIPNLNTALRGDPTFLLHLDNLQNAFEELSIFIAFAFPRQFAGDPHLRVFLDRLWDKQDVLDYISPTSTKSDFIGIFLQNILEPMGELASFSRFMFEFIADAKLAVENRADASQYGHPLIEKALEELQEFEKTVVLATKDIKPIPAITRVSHYLGSYEENEDSEDSLFKAFAKHLQCNAMQLKQEIGTSRDSLEAVAKAKDVEVIVFDESDENTTQIRAVNIGGKTLVHLLHKADQCWYAFYPSESCQKRQDYLAARLMATTSTSETELEELRAQLALLQEVVANLTADPQALPGEKRAASVANSIGQTFLAPPNTKVLTGDTKPNKAGEEPKTLSGFEKGK